MKAKFFDFLTASAVTLIALLTLSFVDSSDKFRSSDLDPVVYDYLVSADMTANAEVLAVDIADRSEADGNKITYEDIMEAKALLELASSTEPNPQLIEFLQYLIAAATGMLAVLLRWLIRRWIPDFPDNKNTLNPNRYK
jgi:hypothetical protein